MKNLLIITSIVLGTSCKPKPPSQAMSTSPTHPLSLNASSGINLKTFQGKATTQSELDQKTIGFYRLKGLESSIAYDALKEIGHHINSELENSNETFYKPWIINPDTNEFKFWDKASHEERLQHKLLGVHYINALDESSTTRKEQKLKIIYDTENLDFYKSNINIMSELTWAVDSNNIIEGKIRTFKKMDHREKNGYINYQIKTLNENLTKTPTKSKTPNHLIVSLDQTIKAAQLKNNDLGLWKNQESKMLDSIKFGLESLSAAKKIKPEDNLKLGSRIAIFENDFHVKINSLAADKAIKQINSYALSNLEKIKSWTENDYTEKLIAQYQEYLAEVSDDKNIKSLSFEKIQETEKKALGLFNRTVLFTEVILDELTKKKQVEEHQVTLRKLEYAGILALHLSYLASQAFIENNTEIIENSFSLGLQYAESINSKSFPTLDASKKLLQQITDEPFNQKNTYIALYNYIETDYQKDQDIDKSISKDKHRKLSLEKQKDRDLSFKNQMTHRYQLFLLDKFNKLSSLLEIRKKAHPNDVKKPLDWKITQGIPGEIIISRFYSME